jgi:hypothetical protein
VRSTSTSAIALAPIVWARVSPLETLLEGSIDDLLQLNTLLLSIAIDELKIEGIDDLGLFHGGPWCTAKLAVSAAR